MTPEPEAGLTVNQVESDDTDQVVFDDTTTPVDPANADTTHHADTFNVNDGVNAAPGCVTDTVRVTCGEPLVVVNVTVALRDADAVFA